MKGRYNALIINAIQIVGGGFCHLTPGFLFRISVAVLQAFGLAKWLFLLPLFLACQSENDAEEAALCTRNLLLGIYSVHSRANEMGVNTLAWPDCYVTFTPDSVLFFSLFPQYEFGLHPSYGTHFLGYERVPEDSYPIQYLPNAVRFDGETYRVIPSDCTFCLLGRVELCWREGYKHKFNLSNKVKYEHI